MKNEKIMYLVLGLVLGIALTIGYYSMHKSDEGVEQQSNNVEDTSGTPSGNISGTFALPGEHCGGNMSTALTCSTGYHCAPTPGSHLPFGDVGGTCVKD